MSREGQGKVKTRQKQGQGEVKARSRQRNHNLNRNYNLMGFDTIEINLVNHYITVIMKSLSLSHVQTVNSKISFFWGGGGGSIYRPFKT